MAAEKKNVVDKVLKLIHQRGGKAFKTDGGYKPDIIGCFMGRFIAFECKDFGLLKNVSEGQQIELDAWVKAGGTALAIDSVKMAESALDIIEEEYYRLHPEVFEF